MVETRVCSGTVDELEEVGEQKAVERGREKDEGEKGIMHFGNGEGTFNG